jgi:hypothetical protein
MSTHIPSPTPKVEKNLPGKKSISWRKDPVILTRLVSVAELSLRGATFQQIATTLEYSLGSAKRDIGRVKTIWKEAATRELLDLQGEALAMYRLVISKAWAAFSKNPNPGYLGHIIGAQKEIDSIMGARPPEILVTTELDIETVRRRRWEELQKNPNLHSILAEGAGDNAQASPEKSQPRAQPNQSFFRER